MAASTTQARLDKLRQQHEQLAARIGQLESKQRQAERKRRDRTLILWGVVVEAMLKSGELSPDAWRSSIQKHLVDARSSQAALAGLDRLLQEAIQEPASQPENKKISL